MSGVPNAERDLAGRQFGRLTALEQAPRPPGQRGALWRCRCDCGAVVVRAASELKRGNTRSCGCLRREMIGDRQRRHGQLNTPEYHAWKNAKARCHTPSSQAYADYGARGIRMCDRWRDSFETFLRDVGLRPSPLHSLDRIDNEGHYEPGNVRWATLSQQNTNRRNGRRLTHDGRTMNVLDWARFLGISPQTITRRLKRQLPLDRVLDARAPIGRPRR